MHIEGFTAGVNRAKVYDLTLADVAVTEVVDSEDHGYSLSLDYSKIALVTNGIDATGKPSQERRVRLRRHQQHRDRPVLAWPEPR